MHDTRHLEYGLDCERPFCRQCGLAPRGRAARSTWISTGCPQRTTMELRIRALDEARSIPTGCIVLVGNTPLHPSHQLVCYRGMYICCKCAHYAASRVRELNNPCPGISTNIGMTILKRFQQGIPPYGMKAWPDGTRSAAIQPEIVLDDDQQRDVVVNDRLRAVYSRVLAKSSTTTQRD